jgi:hypothetical protein
MQELESFEKTEEQVQNEIVVSKLIFATLALSGVFVVGLLLRFDPQDPIGSASSIMMIGGGFLSLLCLLAACLSAISEDISKKMISDRNATLILCKVLVDVAKRDSHD